MTEHKITITTGYCEQDENGKWQERSRTRTVGVGDTVGFKYDVEQSSPIKQIRRKSWGTGYELLVTVTQGDYHHGDLWVDANDCW